MYEGAEVRNPVSHFVHLNDELFKLGYSHGDIIEKDSREKGLRHAYGSEPGIERSYDDNRLGALSEIAVRVLLKLPVYRRPLLGNYNGPDILKNIGVRCRRESYYDLIVRPNDHDDFTYILVIGRTECPIFEVVGYMKGAEAKLHKTQIYGNRPPAHFVERKYLRQIVLKEKKE